MDTPTPTPISAAIRCERCGRQIARREGENIVVQWRDHKGRGVLSVPAMGAWAVLHTCAHCQHRQPLGERPAEAVPAHELRYARRRISESA